MTPWQERIVLNPNILAGKPIVKGTRLSVEFIVDLLAQGWSEEDILTNYPGLASDDIRACLAYASSILRAEKVYPLGMQLMRLLADENSPGVAVEALRQAGHHVQWVRTEAPGSSDHLILRQAQNENRVVVTFDKDFGELAFHYGLPASAGIILFRITAHAPQHVARTAVASLATRQDWLNHFSVVEDRRIRMTPLPGTG